MEAVLSAGLSVDLELVSASVGLEGSLTVIDASLPLTLSAAVGTDGITVTESAKLTMTGLDGEIALTAEACAAGVCADGSLTLFDWTGLKYAGTTIFSASQTIDY